MFKINEIFKSFQGEGLNTSVPSLFIRVYGCDYACSFCDSKGASIWETKLYKEYTTNELIDKIKSELKEVNINNIVLTGGNPLIYDFKDIIDYFASYRFEVETQGSKYHEWINHVNLVTISPKFYYKNYFEHFKHFISKINIFQNIQIKFIIDLSNIDNDLINCLKCLNFINDKQRFKNNIKIYFHFIANKDTYETEQYKYDYKLLFDKINNNKDIKKYFKIYDIRISVQLHKILGFE